MSREHEKNEQGACPSCGSPSYTGSHTPDCPANKKIDDPQYEEKIIASRDQAQEEWEDRAKERNSYRKTWKKIFGVDKTGAMDIATEQAMEMDEEIEKLMQEREAKSVSEAVEIAARQKEFQPKSKEKIKKEEFLRPFVLQLGNVIENNDFSKAGAIISEVRFIKGVDDETRQVFKEIIKPIIDQKIIELIQSKDGENFVKAFLSFEELVKIEDLGTSKEELRVPEIFNAAKGDIIRDFEISGVDSFVSKRDRMVEAGIVTEEEVENWPEIIELRKKVK